MNRSMMAFRLILVFTLALQTKHLDSEAFIDGIGTCIFETMGRGSTLGLCCATDGGPGTIEDRESFERSEKSINDSELGTAN